MWYLSRRAVDRARFAETAARGTMTEGESSVTTIIDRHLSAVEALCRRSPVKRLDAFGSALRADFDPSTSDLDFLVELDEIAPRQYAEAYFTLKEALEKLFGRSVDLVTHASLSNPYFRERVYAERKLVYAR
jgi:uncharacterized protein